MAQLDGRCSFEQKIYVSYDRSCMEFYKVEPRSKNKAKK